jgi:hypothetical protein
MTEQPKSWRDQIKVHPAADLFPMMGEDELKALGEDIKENGLQTGIAVWRASDGRPWFLVDGRNRLDAAELVGLSVKFIKEGGEVTVKIGDYMNAVDDITSMDPYEYVISANVYRRHLTLDQKRDLIAAVLKAQPEKSNRTIAEQAKADHKTVGAVRDRLVSTGEIPQLDKTVGADGKQRKQPAKKKRRDVEDYIAADDGPAQAEGTFPVHFGSCHGGRVVTERSTAKTKGKADSAADPATLSLSAQQKLEAATRRIRRELELEFDKRLQQRLQEALDDTVLPAYNETYAIYRELSEARKGLMTKATYNKIASCLHPDSRNSVTDEKLVDAFQIWRGLEIRLLDETQCPTPTFKWPKTYEELMALKQKVSAARRAKREANMAHRQ